MLTRRIDHRPLHRTLIATLALLPLAPLLAGCESDSQIADRQAQETYNRIMQQRWNATQQQEELEKLANLLRKEQGRLLIPDPPDWFKSTRNANDQRPELPKHPK